MPMSSDHLRAIQELSIEDLRVLHSVILQQIAVPLQNPQQIYDDWNDDKVDELYRGLLQ